MAKFHDVKRDSLKLHWFMQLCLEGATHYNVTTGASDSYTFVGFITECVETVMEYGAPALKPGDVLVVDNAAFHHSGIAQILKQWLARQRSRPNTPQTYPRLKAASVKSRPSFDSQVMELFYRHDLHTSSNMHGYFRNTGFLMNVLKV